MLDGIRGRFRRTQIDDDILASGAIVTADTGFSSDENNDYLREREINAYIPDNQFRSRDKAFKDQKTKYGKRHQKDVKGQLKIIPASEFQFDTKRKTCICPAGRAMWLSCEEAVSKGKKKLHFEGNLSDCRSCSLKQRCMRNPDSVSSREGHGRQVSITVTNGRTGTDWMRRRVDSRQGKVVYGHRMSAVEPVFGNIGTNKGLNRFSLRGREKVKDQCRMFCLVYNIEKLMNCGAIH